MPPDCLRSRGGSVWEVLYVGRQVQTNAGILRQEEYGYSGPKDMAMKVGNLRVVRNIAISSPVARLTRAFEGTADFLVAWFVNKDSEGSVAYKLRHIPSPEETWDCGIFVFHRMQQAPPTLKARLHPTNVDQAVLNQWTQLVVLLNKSARHVEANHQLLTLNRFIEIIPPGTIRWATEPAYTSLGPLLCGFKDANWEAGEAAEEGPPMVLPPTKPRAPAGGPGRPGLSPAEIAQRQEMVDEVRQIRLQTGDTYSEIARRKGIPYRRLIHWLHDTRLKKP